MLFRSFIYDCEGKCRTRTDEWSSAEPQDIFVARSDEWYGPRDWSPRKKKRGDLILGEVGLDERAVVFCEGPGGETIWSLEPFFVEGMLVIIPLSKQQAAVP